jgi:hypothetical protein
MHDCIYLDEPLKLIIKRTKSKVKSHVVWFLFTIVQRYINMSSQQGIKNRTAYPSKPLRSIFKTSIGY